MALLATGPLGASWLRCTTRPSLSGTDTSAALAGLLPAGGARYRYHTACSDPEGARSSAGRTTSSRRSALPEWTYFRPRGREEQRWQEYFLEEERWQDAGPLEEELQQYQQHYLRDVGPH